MISRAAREGTERKRQNKDTAEPFIGTRGVATPAHFRASHTTGRRPRKRAWVVTRKMTKSRLSRTANRVAQVAPGAPALAVMDAGVDAAIYCCYN